MMGPRQVDQAALFYEFSLDRHVPVSHLLSSIDRFVELSDVRVHVAPFYSSTPAFDRFRTAHPNAAGRRLLRHSLRAAVVRGGAPESRRPLVLSARAGRRGAGPLDLLQEQARPLPRLRSAVQALRDCSPALYGRRAGRGIRLCDASLIAAEAVAGSDDVDWEAIARTRRSVREYLDTLDQSAWGVASETVPKFISKADPAAQWTGAHKGHAFLADANNDLIDLKAAIIVDVEATRAIRQAEVGATCTMIERTEERLELCPERIVADRADGSAEMLG